MEGRGDEHSSQEEVNKNKRILIIGRDLKDFALSDFGIPYAMIALTAYFDFNNEAINTEGIFRKPGALSEEERLEEYLENQNYGNIFSIKNPIVVGGVFKKIFAKMPEPLFPYNVYEKMKEFNSKITFLFEFVRSARRRGEEEGRILEDRRCDDAGYQ